MGTGSAVHLPDVFQIPIYSIEGDDEETKIPGGIFKSGIFWVLFLLMICAGASEQAVSQWSSLFAEDGLV